MRYALLSAILLSFSSTSLAGDWLTLPSTYSHDASGARVTQFAKIEAPTAPIASNFRTSGYTHLRSSLNYGSSSDNYHRVQKWGDEVRPYGEWRFPYRPYSTPYPNWGPPYAGLNLGYGGRGFGYGSGYGKGEPHDDESPSDDDKDRRPRGQDFERGFLGGGTWPGDRNRNRQHPIPQPSPFNPYPAGPGTPYPVAPYYDGYSPVYRD